MRLSIGVELEEVGSGGFADTTQAEKYPATSDGPHSCSLMLLEYMAFSNLGDLFSWVDDGVGESDRLMILSSYLFILFWIHFH